MPAFIKHETQRGSGFWGPELLDSLSRKYYNSYYYISNYNLY